jgi:hypothetical protein
MYYVYKIMDPTGKHKPYIGKGTALRMFHHWHEFQLHGKHPHNYKLTKMFRYLDRKGMKPKYVKVFETDSEEAAYTHERILTEDVGLENLSNLRIGGGSWNPDEEQRRKMSFAAKGRTFSEEHRKKLSQAHKGKILSEEHKLKISAKTCGRYFTEEHRRKISNSLVGHRCGMSGRKHTKETRKKMSEALKGKKNALGCKRSEETRKKMSEAAQRCWARRRNDKSGS